MIFLNEHFRELIILSSQVILSLQINDTTKICYISRTLLNYKWSSRHTSIDQTFKYRVWLKYLVSQPNIHYISLVHSFDLVNILYLRSVFAQLIAEISDTTPTDFIMIRHESIGIRDKQINKCQIK